MNGNQFWSTSQAAEAWGVSRRRVLAMCKVPGKIPGIKEAVAGYQIPAGSPKPPEGRPGPKPK